MGAWKLPMFSAREWRRAALAVLGANGSWTWTKSSGTSVKSSSSVRVTSTGRLGPRPLAESTSPARKSDGVLPSPSSACGSLRASRNARRESVAARADSEGATIRTRCPREASSLETASI